MVDYFKQSRLSLYQNHAKDTLSEIFNHQVSDSNEFSETRPQVHFENSDLSSVTTKEGILTENHIIQPSGLLGKENELNECNKKEIQGLSGDSSLVFIPKEWEIQFFTPVKSPINYIPGNSEKVGERTAATNKLENLLDLTDDFFSPLSTFKYSERDLENIKNAFTEQESLKIQNVRLELQNVQENLDTELNKGSKMQTILNDYELTMARMIEDARKLKEEHQSQYFSLLMEKKQIDCDFIKMELGFKDLDRRYQDLKILHERCRKVSENRANSITQAINSIFRY